MSHESFWKESNVLVTGGASFIGSHIVDKLVSYGASVTVLDDLSSGTLENLSQSLDKVKFVTHNLEYNAKDVATHFEKDGISAIIYTDISRDGMMQGLNIPQTDQLARSINTPVIASGGVNSIKDNAQPRSPIKTTFFLPLRSLSLPQYGLNTIHARAEDANIEPV